MRDIVSLLMLLIAIICMTFISYYDIKYRKVPNKLLIPIIIAGLIYAGMHQFLLQSIFSFLLLNIMGIFLLSRIIGAGDAKLFSTFAFFIQLTETKDLAIFVIMTIVILLGYGFVIYPLVHYKTKEERKLHYQREYMNAFLFAANRKNVSKVSFDTLEREKEKTHPMAVQLEILFIATFILTHII